MTCYLLSGTLNPMHSLTDSVWQVTNFSTDYVSLPLKLRPYSGIKMCVLLLLLLLSLLCLCCSETSPVQSECLSAHSHKPAQKDRVYTVATDRTIRSVMAEYRRRKQTHLLPRSASATANKPRSSRRKDSRSSKVTDTAPKVTRGRSMSAISDPVERQIVEQERASIMKVKMSELLAVWRCERGLMITSERMMNEWLNEWNGLLRIAAQCWIIHETLKH